MSDSWFIARSGETYGPYTWEQLVEMAASGNLTATDSLWNENMVGWVQSATVPGLSFAPAPAAPYPAAPQVMHYTTPSRIRSAESSDLDGLDWVIVVLCSGIGCIIGIVRLIQGKRNGGKMLGYSLLFILIWGVIRAVVSNL